MHARLAALIVLPFLAQSAFAAKCARTYTVKEGDYCDSISAAQKVSTYQLSAINPQINAQCNNLKPGEKLCLGYPKEDCTTTYVVKAGDTCEKVEKEAGIDATTFYANNPQLNDKCSNLYVGEVVCTAKSIHVPPAPKGKPKPGSTIPATAVPAAPPAPTNPPEHHDDQHDDDNLPFCDEM